MATSERRRQRYATDEDYRERRLRETRERREAKRQAKLAKIKLRGWEHIHSVPSGHMVMLHDPNIWGPVVAYLGEDGHWHCLHYTGPEPRPTHWRYLPPRPDIE